MNIEKIQSAFKDHLIIFLSPDFKKGIGLETLIPNYAIACGYNSDAITLARDAGINIFCLAEHQTEDLHNSGKILESEVTKDFIKNLQAEKNCSSVAILSFKSSSKINFICEKEGWKLLNLDFELTNTFENKAHFQELTEGLKTLPTVTDQFENLEFNTMIEQFKSFSATKLGQLVVQLPHGFGGASTYFVNQAEFNNLKKEHGEHKVKITPYINGKTLTLNGCVYQDKVYISHPFIQKTGLAKYTRYPSGSYGIDFNTSSIPEICKNTIESAKLLGEIFRTMGLRGFFGLDFITDDNSNSFPIEINPRLTANIHPFTAQQSHNGQLPFLLLHILEFLNIQIPPPEPNSYLTPLCGQTTIFRNITNETMTVNQEKLANGYSFSQLLENPDLKELFIPFLNNSQIHPDFEWAELWTIDT